MVSGGSIRYTMEHNMRVVPFIRLRLVHRANAADHKPNPGRDTPIRQGKTRSIPSIVKSTLFDSHLVRRQAFRGDEGAEWSHRRCATCFDAWDSPTSPLPFSRGGFATSNLETAFSAHCLVVLFRNVTLRAPFSCRGSSRSRLPPLRLARMLLPYAIPQPVPARLNQIRAGYVTGC
jgi:hypothetical protein